MKSFDELINERMQGLEDIFPEYKSDIQAYLQNKKSGYRWRFDILIQYIQEIEWLLELRELTKEAKEFLNKFAHNFRLGYSSLWKTWMWKRAKLWYYRFITRDSLTMFQCGICEKEIDDDYKKYTFHHKEYDIDNIFNPEYVSLVHRECHKKYHENNRNDSQNED